MTRIAIVGAGNLGSYLGAQLAAAGHEVFFCVRRPPRSTSVAGASTASLPFYLSDPPPCDLVLLTVKSYDTPAAMPWLKELCPDGQPVAVVQNGIHHEQRVRPFRAIPVLSYIYVEERAGLYYAFAPSRAALSTSQGELPYRFAGLFQGTKTPVRNEANFHQAAWRKMLHNCVSNPLTAIARRGLEILAETEYHAWSRAILKEGLQVANADGAELGPEAAEEILEVLATYPAGTRTSMLQDVERGKRLELDVLNGKLVALGAAYGIDMDANRRVLGRLGYSS